MEAPIIDETTDPRRRCLFERPADDVDIAALADQTPRHDGSVAVDGHYVCCFLSFATPPFDPSPL